jgi:hypothetical protein
MIQTTGDTASFRLDRAHYVRIRLLAWVLICVSLVVAAVTALLGVLFWPTYTHTFTLYLKWQDALLAILWFDSFALVWGSVLVARFLFALHAGYHEGMFFVHEDRAITVRDLSPQNLKSIYQMIGTAFSCFLAALIGLIPEILIGWTIHLPHPALVFFGTTAAILLSLAGLAVTAVSVAFIVIGFTGSFSFSRKMGAPHTYELTSQAILRIDGLELTVIYPDKPESLFDLTLLDSEDQRRLLHLLRQRWLDADRPWSLLLDNEIKAALSEAQEAQHTVLV